MFNAEVVVHVDVDQDMVKGGKPCGVVPEDDVVVDGPVIEDVHVLGIDAPDHLVFEEDVAIFVIDFDDPVGIGSVVERPNDQVGFYKGA